MNTQTLREHVARVSPCVHALHVREGAIYLFVDSRAQRAELAQISAAVSDLVPLGAAAILVINRTFG